MKKARVSVLFLVTCSSVFSTIPFYLPFFDWFCRILSHKNDKKWKNPQKMSMPTIAFIAKMWYFIRAVNPLRQRARQRDKNR